MPLSLRLKGCHAKSDRIAEVGESEIHWGVPSPKMDFNLGPYGKWYSGR